MSYIVNETYTIFFNHFLLLNILTVLKLICKWFPSFYNRLFILIKIRNIWNLNSYLHKLLYSRINFINISDSILVKLINQDYSVYIIFILQLIESLLKIK